MIKIKRAEVHKKSEKGMTAQLREHGVQFDGVEIVTCPKGKVRGNHYHEKKTEYIYVFSGSITLETQDQTNNIEKYKLNPGDCAVVPPMVKHRVRGNEESVLVIPFTGPSSLEDNHPW